MRDAISNGEKNKSAGIKSWPKDDRPREKLLKKGASALSNSELLAVLLRTGAEGASAIDLENLSGSNFTVRRSDNYPCNISADRYNMHHRL